MPKRNIELQISEDEVDTAYLLLPDHPGVGTPGCAVRQTRLLEVLEGYKGPDIYLDFSEDGTLIGIEILA